MKNKKILFICGSLNQTTMLYKIGQHLSEYDLWFTPYYADGFIEFIRRLGWLEFCILGGKFKKNTMEFLNKNNCQIDYRGKKNDYDLVFTCSDLVVPRSVRKKKSILVQEGMTDPENWLFYLVKYLRLPRWAAATSTTGLSDAYNYLCAASEGYRELFIKKGVKPKKIIVTGIPNFDDVSSFVNNDFPHKNFVLVATSDMRDTYKYENRIKFIKRAVEIANGKKLIFKLHPNENVKRATAEINKYAPEALVYHDGEIGEMIANCDTLFTRYSSSVYTALALGKEVISDINPEELRKLMPNQNGGVSAKNIADFARKIIENENA